MSVSARVERLWAHAITHTVVWPTGELDPSRWAGACAAVVAGAEDGSYVARVAGEAARAVGLSPSAFLGTYAERFVRVSDARGRDEFTRLVRDDVLRDPALPFTVVVRAGGGLALSHSHELGDGRVSAALLEALVTAYDDPWAPLRAPARPAGDGELLAALVGTWSKRPWRAVRAARGIARRLCRHTGSEPAVVTGDAVGRTETVVLDECAVAAVERWRRDRTPSPSISMSLFTAVSRALREQGYPRRQRWQVMVSMRGGMPSLERYGGNLASRVLVDMDDPRDPADIGREVLARVRSGEVLALHMIKMGVLLVHQEARRLRGAPVRAERTRRSSGLSFTDRGRHAYSPEFAGRIPRAAGTTPEVFTFVRPVRPGIGVNVNWLDGRAHLALTFGSSPLDDDAIDGVVAALEGGVAALLDDAGADHPIGWAPTAGENERAPAQSPRC